MKSQKRKINSSLNSSCSDDETMSKLRSAEEEIYSCAEARGESLCCSSCCCCC